MRYICHAYGWRTLWGALAWKWQKVRKEPRYSGITHFLLRRRKKGTKLLCRANAWKNIFLFSNNLRSGAFDPRCALKYGLKIYRDLLNGSVFDSEVRGLRAQIMQFRGKGLARGRITLVHPDWQLIHPIAIKFLCKWQEPAFGHIIKVNIHGLNVCG